MPIQLDQPLVDVDEFHSQLQVFLSTQFFPFHFARDDNCSDIYLTDKIVEPDHYIMVDWQEGEPYGEAYCVNCERYIGIIC